MTDLIFQKLPPEESNGNEEMPGRDLFLVATFTVKRDPNVPQFFRRRRTKKTSSLQQHGAIVMLIRTRGIRYFKISV
jgi:hypothetical protein